jgi:hypothetical protein
MSYIQEVARDALQAAGSDLAKARRAFMLVAGILALIHLLTVYPYLQASREIVGVEKTIGDNAALLARIEPRIAALKKAGESAASALADLLDGVTKEMIRRFDELRDLVERAASGESIAVAPELPGALDSPIQQMAAPPVSNLPRFPIQQTVPDDDQLPSAPSSGVSALSVSPELKVILDAILAGNSDAYARLTDYAREDIVAAAYADAEAEWSVEIRPAYLEALKATEEQTRLAAETASASSMEIAPSLAAALADMARQREAVEAIRIRHDANVDDALGTEWWRTVEGKGRHASAVTQNIETQLEQIGITASSPAAALRTALDLQEQFRVALQNRQQELERQFVDQREQLAALSGTSGAIPVDLATFIGVFPLVLGLALGFMLLRAGEPRRQAAIAADDLAASGSEDRATRLYLVRRALGGGTAFGPLVLTGALAVGALAWIGLAATQVGASPDPPLPAWTSGGIATLLVLAAAVWDGTSIRRLASNLER